MITARDDGFYTREELLGLGFSSVGTNVRVSHKCSLYAIKGSIGSHVRVDDFSILKGQIEIGDHVHICGFCSVSGVCGIVRLGSFSTLANRVSVYTGSDDYRADALSSSTIPEAYLATVKGDVMLEEAALIGAHSIILPGTRIGKAASIGSLCIVHGQIPAGQILVSQGRGLVSRGTRNVEKILDLASQVASKDQNTSWF